MKPLCRMLRAQDKKLRGKVSAGEKTRKMVMNEGLPVLAFASAREWEAWLAENPGSTGGLWIQFAKKGSGIPSVTHPEALDVALCHGWIDCRKAPLDGSYWMQRFAPRRPRSKWSQKNCARALELAALGRMKPGGRTEIERAKADGRWDAAYPPQSTAKAPADLEAALDANPKARAFFAALNSVNRYAILYRVADAKRPETRARRIAKFIAMLNEGKTIHPASAASTGTGR